MQHNLIPEMEIFKKCFFLKGVFFSPHLTFIQNSFPVTLRTNTTISVFQEMFSNSLAKNYLKIYFEFFKQVCPPQMTFSKRTIFTWEVFPSPREELYLHAKASEEWYAGSCGVHLWDVAFWSRKGR